MQQTTISTHFPKKLQKLTRKVAKLLSEKYKLDGNTQSIEKNNLLEDLKIHSQDIQNAFEKSQKMNTKLKLIRTMLGYQYESSQKKQNLKTPQRQQQKKSQEKGINLKQFVMSMRKRNELTDKYFKRRRMKSIEENVTNFDPQSKNVQQYTDASLKYVHSFLPHQTLLEHSNQKTKKSSQFLTLTPQYEKTNSPISKNHQHIQAFDNSHSESGRLQSVASIQKQKQVIFIKKRSLTINNQNHNAFHSKNSFHNTPVSKKESLNLPIVQNENLSNHHEYKFINNNTTMDVYANRVTQLIYRGKNYNKQLKNNLRPHREAQKSINLLEHTEKDSFKEVLPVIKQCIPQNRSRPVHIPHS